NWRQAFLYEYWPDNPSKPSQGKKPNVPEILAVRTATHKLITYPGREVWTELFDLGIDPYETRNLLHSVDAPGQLARYSELCAQLRQLLRETDYIDRPSVHS